MHINAIEFCCSKAYVRFRTFSTPVALLLYLSSPFVLLPLAILPPPPSAFLSLTSINSSCLTTVNCFTHGPVDHVMKLCTSAVGMERVKFTRKYHFPQHQPLHPKCQDPLNQEREKQERERERERPKAGRKLTKG